MTDSLKAAHEAIDQVEAQCIYCDGRGITRDRKVPCNGSLHKVSKEAHAALDKAVEEARQLGRSEEWERTDAERIASARAAERERVLREAYALAAGIAARDESSDVRLGQVVNSLYSLILRGDSE